MKIATYNVNGITARLPRLLEWLQAAKPDVVGLQEIKIDNERFPYKAIEEAGYHALVHGQKGFNGVAILSRNPAQEILRGLPGNDEDIQSRWIEAEVDGIHFCNLYLPNGNPAPGPKFDYKLEWMDRLLLRATELLKSEKPAILAGDWNICPTDFDIARPPMMEGDALVLPESRGRFRRLQALGYTDAIRMKMPEADCYSYWDYQAGAWPKNWGIRIDHLMLTPTAADRLHNAGIDRYVRGEERASDHVPVWIELN